jgi:perosamine synthetase
MAIAHFRSYSKHLSWDQCEGREIVFTYQGRNAIALICKILNVGANDEVIVPAYNCGAEIDPFIRTGAKAVLYRIDNKLNIDVDDIMRRVTPSTRIIYVTHFFGWPQDISALAEWCKKKRIFLIEDCAQALFSRGPDNSIGRHGDAAIYSFVKTLPTPDGGALAIKKEVLKERPERITPEFKAVVRNSLPLFKKWFMNSIGFWQKFEATRNLLLKSWKGSPEKRRDEQRPSMLKNNYLVERQINWTMSRISRGILNSSDVNSIVKKRRRNFQYLNDNLPNIPGFTPVHVGLPVNICPMCFPFVVKDRRYWYDALDSKGILVQGWPGYYPGFNWDQYPEACNLKDNLLTLPVHHYLDIRHMKYMGECVRKIGKVA